MEHQQSYVLRTVEERKVRLVRLWFCDVLGQLESVAISPVELEAVFEDGIQFDGSAIDGFSRVQESDVLAIPDASSFQLMTWGDSAEFRDCHHTNWLVDGVLDPYLEYEYTASSAESATIERFDKQVDRANLHRLASAKLIEFQVCGVEGQISQSDMDGMRRVLDATK